MRTALLGALCLTACSGGTVAPPDGFTETEWATIKGMSPLPAVPADPTNKYADNEAAAAFGRKFFWEKRYSGPISTATAGDGTNGELGLAGETGKVSCGSCHFPEYGWAENRSKPNNLSLGANRTVRNTPSILNVGFYEWFTWAGRLDSLWAQGAASPESPDVVGNRCGVAHLLYDFYKEEYNGIFDDDLPEALNPAAPDAARFPPACKPKAMGAADGPWEMMDPADRTLVLRIMSNVGKGLAAYERKLVSGNSAFDKYVAGDTKAMSASAKRGLKVFIGAGFCVQCHSGPIFSDQKFHNLGVPQTGPNVPATDTGRFDDLPRALANPYNTKSPFSDSVETGNAKWDGLMAVEADRGAFRTKNLRGCAETAPYDHSGAFATLKEVVEFYDVGGGSTPYTKDEKLKPLNLTAEQKDDLVAFLQSLTGEPVPAELGPP